MFLVCVTSDRIFFFLKGHVSGSGQPHTCMCMTMHGLAWFLHEHTKVCTSGRGVGEKLPARLLVLSCNRTSSVDRTKLLNCHVRLESKKSLSLSHFFAYN
jgi:hypothetical protein